MYKVLLGIISLTSKIGVRHNLLWKKQIRILNNRSNINNCAWTNILKKILILIILKLYFNVKKKRTLKSRNYCKMERPSIIILGPDCHFCRDRVFIIISEDYFSSSNNKEPNKSKAIPSAKTIKNSKKTISSNLCDHQKCRERVNVKGTLLAL